MKLHVNLQANLHAIRAIYLFEMHRTWRTVMQSIISPVLSTTLYFVVFGACLLYTSPSPRDRTRSRMPSSA